MNKRIRINPAERQAEYFKFYLSTNTITIKKNMD